MKINVLKTKKYRPKLVKKLVMDRFRADNCFIQVSIIDDIYKELKSLFKGFRYTVFEVDKEIEYDKLQDEGYKKLLEFQRAGCCFSYLLTPHGCRLCKDRDLLEDGSPNPNGRYRRCTRFDSSKNRSRSWKLMGIKYKDNGRRFIILWKPLKKYVNKIREVLGVQSTDLKPKKLTYKLSRKIREN